MLCWMTARDDRVRLSIASSFPAGSGGASAARTSALPGHESSPLDRIRPAGLPALCRVAAPVRVRHARCLDPCRRPVAAPTLACLSGRHVFRLDPAHLPDRSPLALDHPFRICSSMRFRATGSSDTMADRRESKSKIRRRSRGGSPPASAKLGGEIKSPGLNRAAHPCGPVNLRPRSITVGFNLQQRERTEHMGQIGRRRRMQVGLVEFGETPDPEQPQAPDHLVFE